MAIFASNYIVGKNDHQDSTTTSGGTDTSTSFYRGPLLGLGYKAIFQTPTIFSSSGATSSDFMTVYSSSHWGQDQMFDISVITTYYRPAIVTWRCTLQNDTFKYHKLFEGSNNRTTAGGDFDGGGVLGSLSIYRPSDNASLALTTNTADGSTSTYSHQVGSGSYSGQNVYKQNIKFNTGASYGYSYALVKIFDGGMTRVFFSNSSVGNVDTNCAGAGAAFHFKTISQKTDYHNDLSV
tara:strand:- start:64 stop:774 length:711 start_codon:yes stop_codon:yes gene_type:complete